MVDAGLIEYIEFPQALVGKYQCFTEADLGRLRSIGCDHAFVDVATGVARYAAALAASAPPDPLRGGTARRRTAALNSEGRASATTAHRRPTGRRSNRLPEVIMFKQILAALAALVFAAAAHAAVDANTASQAELEAIRGIGPTLSTVIGSERNKTVFQDWSDLVGRVKGLGERNAAKFSERGLTVDGKPYAATTSTSATSATKTKPAASKPAPRGVHNAPAGEAGGSASPR